MTTATLSFNLPEEESDFLLAARAQKVASALWQFDNWLRAQYKYEDKDTVDVMETRQKLQEFLEGHGVTWEEVMG